MFRQNKLIVRPNRKSISKLCLKTSQIIRKNRSISQAHLIGVLNPIIRGWGNYFKHSCAKKTFTVVDDKIFHDLLTWARRRHQNKTTIWIKERYFPKIKNRLWNFKTPDKEKGLKIIRLEDIHIERYVKVRNEAIPYDKKYDLYFFKRKTKRTRMDSKTPRKRKKS